MERLKDEKKLLKSFVDGNERAFEMILDHYSSYLLSFLYRLSGNKDTAEELSQEVFIRFIKAAKDLKGESSIGTWLYRVAYNVFIDRVRVREPLHEEIDDRVMSVEDKSFMPEKNVERKELKKKLFDSISRLPKEQGAAIYLFYFEEVDLKETARILKATEGKVKTLLFRGRENLREIMLPSLEE
jgi:RNA polymerase sigma-70 factor, ECF subfamily